MVCDGGGGCQRSSMWLKDVWHIVLGHIVEFDAKALQMGSNQGRSNVGKFYFVQRFIF